MAPIPHRCWVEVSRRQIAGNFAAIRALVGPDVGVMPVVKADAYRHGAGPVSKALVEAGAEWLAVSNVEEGVKLRQGGLTCSILVMGDFLPFERPAFADYQLTPVIHSLEQLTQYDHFSEALDQPLEFHLAIDSGMGRLGVNDSPEAVAQVAAGLRHARLTGLMTHFASPGDYSSPQTDEQLERFAAVRSALAAAGVNPPIVHLSSSLPIAYGRREAWGNMVRPGLALYGYIGAGKGPVPECLLTVKPALSWKARILEVKHLPVGARVGYNAMFAAQRPTRMAILAVGYADGLPHHLSNSGKVIAGGCWAPIIGAVSMDLTAIDITDCPPLAQGDAATLLGCENGLTLGADEVARVAGTISYSVLCGIGQRVKHIFS